MLGEGSSQALTEAREFIDSRLKERQVNRILHGFPSPRFWQPGAVSVPEVMRHRAVWNEESPAPFELYVGVPFCIRTDPDRCGYCLFPVEVFKGAGQMDTYLDYLRREGELFRPYFEGVSPESVYIGGGTPNLMRPEQYTRMMEIIRGVFPALSPAAPVTLEGIPQAFTREKLAYMKAGGINRVSMGVQQLNTELNKLSGRKQTAQHVFDAIRWCQELGLQCNADLIFGWPRQTVETMLADLEQLVATGVDHVAHYELNIGGPTDFSLNRRHELPSVELTREMYGVARDFLTSRGYRQLTAYDFQKAGDGSEFVYEECERGAGRRELWGWGFAGVSDFGGTAEHAGWTYLNRRRVEDYFAALDRGEFPVERGFAREHADLRLNTLFRNLQGMSVDRPSYARRFGLDVFEEFEPVWRALVERGWCSVEPETIRLHGDGVYYVPLIQNLLSQTRLEQLRASAATAAFDPPPAPPGQQPVRIGGAG
ncbi:MAG TPA: coproporphyrinogen-III oxidase family protein [Pyrinomonadaceae bacterium]